MSRIPGSSPITNDIEDIRHSEEDGFFGEDRGLGGDEAEGSVGEPSDEDPDDLDALASASVEGGRPAKGEGWWHSA